LIGCAHAARRRKPFSEPAHDLAAWGRESAGWAATPPAAQQTENRAGNQE